MIHDIMPETEDYLNKNKVSGYIGFDTTSDSLHIGSLVQIMIFFSYYECRACEELIQLFSPACINFINQSDSSWPLW